MEKINTITRRQKSLQVKSRLKLSVSFRARLHEPGCFGVGWPGCHVIAKLNFVAFNNHAETPANSNQPGSCNQALNVLAAGFHWRRSRS